MMADTETVALVRELNHRVKNNFQIIASLINLKKRGADHCAREEIRFIEEHVTAMAVAYRLVYATGPMVEVDAADLLPEFVTALRMIAGLSPDQVSIEGEGLDGAVGLDQAIALGLYLSVSLPLYLDHALASGGRVIVRTEAAQGGHLISISGDWGHGIAFDFLRRKLMAAYVHRLGAKVDQDSATGGLSLCIPLPIVDAGTVR